MYNDDEYLLLSGIQHFAFCRRRWALIHVEQQWAENELTAEGRIQHNRVHNSNVRDFRNGILTVRGMGVRSSILGMTGNCDAVEFIPDTNGITLHGYEGFWKVRPIEYKHGTSSAKYADRLQSVGQAICLEEMLCCVIDEVCLFYRETRRREYISVTQDLRDEVINISKEMHELYSRGYTPRVKPRPVCKGCSMHDICVPELQKHQNVALYIEKALEKET